MSLHKYEAKIALAKQQSALRILSSSTDLLQEGCVLFIDDLWLQLSACFNRKHCLCSVWKLFLALHIKRWITAPDKWMRDSARLPRGCKRGLKSSDVPLGTQNRICLLGEEQMARHYISTYYGIHPAMANVLCWLWENTNVSWSFGPYCWTKAF